MTFPSLSVTSMDFQIRRSGSPSRVRLRTSRRVSMTSSSLASAPPSSAAIRRASSRPPARTSSRYRRESDPEMRCPKRKMMPRIRTKKTTAAPAYCSLSELRVPDLLPIWVIVARYRLSFPTASSRRSRSKQHATPSPHFSPGVYCGRRMAAICRAFRESRSSKELYYVCVARSAKNPTTDYPSPSSSRNLVRSAGSDQTPQAVRMSDVLLVRSHVNSGSSRPKWPNAAVFL